MVLVVEREAEVGDLREMPPGHQDVLALQVAAAKREWGHEERARALGWRGHVVRQV